MSTSHTLFLPCAAGVEGFLASEVQAITGAARVQAQRAGVQLSAPWPAVLRLNLHSRLAQRVLVQLAHAPYRSEDDVYQLAAGVRWQEWFQPSQTFRVDVTAQRSPLKSLNFAALRVKDAVADRFRQLSGSRPSVDTQRPQVRIHLHLSETHASVSIDTSGEPLFKRGWREDKGDAPLKETLAAAMIAACGWTPESGLPLYDPCCGSGTIVIEAAQIACRIAPGLRRRFAFEQLLTHQSASWKAIKEEAASAVRTNAAPVFGSDISHRMVDFARRNAERAGVAAAVQLRGGDALERMPPCEEPGVMLLNPPYGERIAAAGAAGVNSRERSLAPRPGRETAQTPGGDGEDFFRQLASHWKRHYAGWQAWLLTPDRELPGAMRLKATRRVPLFNGPIECRLLRFDMVAGSARGQRPTGSEDTAP
ncbi:class I SAM-dependent RNA methyltransferase [Comamonas sp. NLF-1-9]|uniref:THUMP domain-containing class I SAM-dependent RNA methyltransferase n=1 Tax=Comamonas sp. NLF-1-9 TaxID=2853163 RepID=UPI001C47B1E4|nr:THUMP domain-containing protein [Comamonas sp. NLF-1-9]QXL83846.1 class I SAM-dependent RNA methyltransferase [Comamonas sp. NLF-1-9]